MSTKPIYATPKMDREASRRIYQELRETVPSPEKAHKLRQADGVFARAKKRAQDAVDAERRGGGSA